MKKIITIILAAAVMLSISGCSADNNSNQEKAIIKTAEFVSDDSDYNYSFPEKINEDGKNYKLQDISYEELNVEDVTEDVVVTNGIELGEVYKKGDISAAQNKNIDGVRYDLKQIEYAPAVISGRTAYMTGQIEYPNQTEAPAAPTEHAFSVVDPQTGDLVSDVIPLVSLTDGGYTWKEDISLTSTVYIYNADMYEYAGEWIPYNNTQPEIPYSLILQDMELAPESYKILSLEWQGNPYDKDGVVCRDIIAKAARYVADYTATYVGEAKLPDFEGYKATAIYEGVKTETTAERKYTVLATATYKTEAPIVYFVLGGLLLAIAVVAVLVIISKTKNMNKKGEIKK